MNAASKKQRSVKLVGCFFCGTKSQIHTQDLRPDYCKKHYKILTAIAPASLVEQHRRQYLHTGKAGSGRKRTTLREAMRDLKVLARQLA